MLNLYLRDTLGSLDSRIPSSYMKSFILILFGRLRIFLIFYENISLESILIIAVINSFWGVEIKVRFKNLKIH